MRTARSHTAALVALVALAAPFVACAAGDMSLQVGPGPVTTQSEDPGDSGTIVADTGISATTNLPPPSPPASDDSGSAAASDDAGSTDDDAGQTSDDSAAPPPPAVDSGSTSSCPGYAAPTTAASCDCTPSSSSHTCAANGCYGGYYCKLSSDACEKKPSSC